MNISKKSLVLSLILSGFFGLCIFAATHAQSTALTQDQFDSITGNCTTIKSTLNQLHSNDALLRVNAGQTYESILTKLMKRFNERVAYNNMFGDELESAAINFETMLNVFRSDYVAYEQQLSSTIDIDCAARPQAFYDALALARERRATLHNDVLNLNLAIENYSAMLDKFGIDNQTAIERMSQ